METHYRAIDSLSRELATAYMAVEVAEVRPKSVLTLTLTLILTLTLLLPPPALTLNPFLGTARERPALLPPFDARRAAPA